MLKHHFETSADAANLDSIGNGQAYLKWVEKISEFPEMAASVVASYSRYLASINYTGDPDVPDHEEPCEIYLLKAARAYLCDWLDYEFQNIDFTPEDSFSMWLHSEGRVWLFNDSLTNTLIKALRGPDCEASIRLQQEMAKTPGLNF